MVIVLEVYDLKNNCYGCNACYNVCPNKAISTHADQEGFLYPMINDALCLECGNCREVCPIYTDKLDINHSKSDFNQHNSLDNAMDTNFEQKVYAVKHREEAIRMKSSSGGMFTAISDFILGQGGIIYGAAFDENLNVCHKRATTKQEQSELRGSKYVQSEIGNTYKTIEKDLLNNRLVLFTGTPCQIAGLKKYLKDINITNLILCDIVCHGVPSPQLWREYIYFAQRKRKKLLKFHYFRTKINGWHSMTSKNVFQNHKEDYKSILSQVHMSLFLSNMILRPCCYSCSFSSMQRVSDITIADFWGVERTLPEYDDNKGISLVLTNTSKGQELLTAVSEVIEVRESNAVSCKQSSLVEPATLLPERKEFWKAYHKRGYEYVAKKYAGYTINNRVKQTIYDQLKKWKNSI